MDAPPTGRVVTFLGVTEAMADLAKRGPIHSQAEGVVRLLHSPDTIVHLVTLLEDMPVTETLEAIAHLREADLPVGTIIVNAATESRLPAGALEAAAEGELDIAKLAAGLKKAGIAASPEMLARAGHAGRPNTRSGCWTRRIAAQQLAATGLPMMSLPRLVDGADLGGVYELADRLAEQGVMMSRTAASAQASAQHDRTEARPRADAGRHRTKIVVTCGSGGVGKTTTAAAMALWAADAGPQGRGADHRPGQAARPVARPGGAGQRPAAGGHRTRRRRRRAVGDDAGHPAHVRRDGGRPLHPGAGRGDPGQPVLQGDLHLVLRHPGVHGDGEAEHPGRHQHSST